MPPNLYMDHSAKNTMPRDRMAFPQGAEGQRGCIHIYLARGACTRETTILENAFDGLSKAPGYLGRAHMNQTITQKMV